MPGPSAPQGNGRDMLNYPQGNDRDMYQVQGAQNLTAFTQGTVTNRSGRHVPGPSAPHNFSPETPNVAGTPDFDSIRDVLFFGDTFASLDVDVSPLPHRERTTEATMATPLPTQTRPPATEGGLAPGVPVVPQPGTTRASPGSEGLPRKAAEPASNTTGKVTG